MMFEMPLLDALSIQADCTYPSDLRYLNGWQQMRLARTLERIPPDAAGLKEWNDALEYLTGDSTPRATADEARSALIAGLAAP